MNLRPYQEQARAAIHDAWREVDRALLVLPTGTGKTIVFAAVTRDVVERRGRVLILAHRGELLQQAADKLAMATGLGCAVEKADESAHGCLERVTVGSVQTLMRESRRAAFDRDHYTHIIIDEAHHALAASYQDVVAHFAGAKVLGVTATPDRGDQRNLGQYFERLAYEYSLPQAIRDGWLSPIRALTIPLSIELGRLTVQSGDFKAGELDAALAPYLEQIADEMKQHAAGRKTLVFLPLIATARDFAAMLAARGFRANWTAGEDPERSSKLRAFEANDFDVLCNSMLLTEGYDCPAVDCVVNLRPTKVRSLYAQIVGRGTRICPGKENLLLLDFLWHTEKHELCRPASLIAESDEVARKITNMAEAAAGNPLDLMADLVEKAEKEVVRDREAALADELRAMRNRQRKLVDPLQFAVSVNASDLVDYAPAFGWEMAPPSKAQLDKLDKAGIFSDEVKNAGMASKLIEHLGNRRAAGYATPKQIRCLERHGFQHVGEMTFRDANHLITRISANGWRVPDDLKPARQVELAIS